MSLKTKLKGVLGLLTGSYLLLIGTLHTTGKKLSKSRSGYQNKPFVKNFPLVKNVVYKCSGCRYWQGENKCSIVKGRIDPDGSCNYWMFGRVDKISEQEYRRLKA